MKKSDIGTAASDLTKAQFSDEISSFVTLSKAQLDELFPTKTDREELAQLVDVVLNSADDNQRKAKLIAMVGQVGGAAVKLLQKVIV